MIVTPGIGRMRALVGLVALALVAGGCGGGHDSAGHDDGHGGGSHAAGHGGGHGSAGHGGGHDGHAASGGHSAPSVPRSSKGTVLDADELLELLQDDFKRHDPQTYCELDLGEFRVTRSLGLEEGTLQVRFHLYGVLPDDKAPKFQELAAHYDSRLRDAVLSLVQSCDLNELTTPRMGAVKAQLTRTINEMLRTRSLRDVVFSELTIDRG